VRSSAKEEAFIYGGAAGLGLGFNAGNSSLQVTSGGFIPQMGLLSGLIPQNEQVLRKFYRDIYYYDAVGGSAADMLSTFPYSEYTLTGVEQNRIDKYTESMVRLNIRQLMPQVTLGFLVDGEYCSSLIFNQRDKVFIDLINYPVDDCRVEHTAFMGLDPTITVKTNEMLRKFITSQSRQARAMRQMLPPSLLQVLQEPAFELDPLTALYVARRTIPGAEPISWLKRMLPVYLIERTLYRGTLVEAQRRQRSMLHIAMGDDLHEFTPEEMAETVNQFQMGDQDPLGAIIGTRNNVQVQEVRQGGDFWKWTDNIDTLTPFKLRALGISEAFLSGDSTYSNVETGMSVFMENTDTLRSNMTYEILTNKIFPIVAVANDFFKPGKQVDTESRKRMQFQLSNHHDLDIPTVRWHKRLEVKPEESMMELLTSLSEKGFPIPLRMWAAAAKVDLNTLYQDLEQDKLIKEKLAKLSGLPEDQIGVAQPGDPDSVGGADGGGGGDWGGGADGDDDSSSSFDDDDDDEDTTPKKTKPADMSSGAGFGGTDEKEEARMLMAALTAAGRLKKVPLLARQFERDNEVSARTKTGKRKAIPQHMQKAARDKLNHSIVKAMVALQDPDKRREVLRRVKAMNGGRVPKLV
jgi:hypothetical protein